MAKGIGGKTYEAILYVCLQYLLKENTISGIIMWNKKPDAIGVEPDFMVGSNSENPDFVFAVSHGDSPKESNRKCWRNISELCEMKTKLFSQPKVYNIVFDSHIKEDIKALQAEAFDGQLIIGDTTYGTKVIEWVNRNMNSLPIGQNEKAEAISQRAKKDTALYNSITQIVNDLRGMIVASGGNNLDSLWNMERARDSKPIPASRITYFKRGLAKRLLIGDSIDINNIKKSDGIWLSELKLAKKNIGGYTIIDDELRWFINSNYNSKYKHIAEQCSSEGFIQQMSKVKNLALIDLFCQYVYDNYELLTREEGMYSCLCKQYCSPALEIDIPSGVDEPHNVWMYDVITALTKATTKKSQGFGYSFFAVHRNSNDSKIGGMSIGEWCSCFMNQFFTRKDGFNAPETAVHYVSLVLSDQLLSINKDVILEMQRDIRNKYIVKEYEDTYLSHRGFAPLQQLLIDEGITENINARIRTCFGEKANLSGQSGTCSVAIAKHTIIKCLSAFANPMDKRKELCAQAVGLRYSWNKEKTLFEKRSGIDKLILLLDGTWTQKDISLLVTAGWDEIFYPDEIDKLKAAIV